MTGLERVQSHMEKFGRRADPAEIVADYGDGAVIEMSGVEHCGADAIAAFFKANYEMVGDQEFEDVIYTENGDGTVEINWKIGPMPGGDKFWFTDDSMFEKQRVFVGQKPANW